MTLTMYNLQCTQIIRPNKAACIFWNWSSQEIRGKHSIDAVNLLCRRADFHSTNRLSFKRLHKYLGIQPNVHNWLCCGLRSLSFHSFYVDWQIVFFFPLQFTLNPLLVGRCLCCDLIWSCLQLSKHGLLSLFVHLFNFKLDFELFKSNVFISIGSCVREVFEKSVSSAIVSA